MRKKIWMAVLLGLGIFFLSQDAASQTAPADSAEIEQEANEILEMMGIDISKISKNNSAKEERADSLQAAKPEPEEIIPVQADSTPPPLPAPLSPPPVATPPVPPVAEPAKTYYSRVVTTQVINSGQQYASAYSAYPGYDAYSGYISYEDQARLELERAKAIAERLARKFAQETARQDSIATNRNLVSNTRWDNEPSGETGLASYYAEPFHGRRMANGQIFNTFDPNMAASRTLPLGTRVLVTDTRTGRSITVTITDRGPYVTGRVIDLSSAGAKLLASDFIARGTIPVRVTPLFGDGKWVWPVLGRHKTQSYQIGHRALDIDGVMGGPVFAIADGQVTKTGWHQFHGNYVEIDHGNGRRSVYGHLSRFDVQVGDVVKAGQLIARIGNTGNVHAGWNSDGSHLHLEIWQSGHPVNPLTFLK